MSGSSTGHHGVRDRLSESMSLGHEIHSASEDLVFFKRLEVRYLASFYVERAVKSLFGPVR